MIDQLAWVQQEIDRIRATVPAERPRGGVSFGELLRAIRNPYTPAHVLDNMHPRTSCRCYQRQRRKVWNDTEHLRWWRDELRLEYARLLRRLERGGFMPAFMLRNDNVLRKNDELKGKFNAEGIGRCAVGAE